MATDKQIKAVLEGYEVNSGVDSWLEHMREKTWFDSKEESNFKRAYKRAEELLKK